MTTPHQPSGTNSAHRHTGAAGPSGTRWLIDHAAVVHAVAYLCAGACVVGLLTGATAVAWLLLAALTTDRNLCPASAPCPHIPSRCASDD
jgi:hypothetical protein